MITGRRASQGANRANLKPLEVDATGLLKLNPLFAWTFDQVETYIEQNKVPHNKLLSEGYKSVGDWHSTQKSVQGEDSGERAGRWAGREKTECGLHEDYFKMKELVGYSNVVCSLGVGLISILRRQRRRKMLELPYRPRRNGRLFIPKFNPILLVNLTDACCRLAVL